MKYVLPLMLLGSAALAAAHGTAWDPARFWPSADIPTGQSLDVDPPWLSSGWEEGAAEHQHAGEHPHAGLNAGDDPHAATFAGDDPHAGMYAGDDPHAGMYAGDDPHAGMQVSDDPHAGVLQPAPEVEPPLAVSRSGAANGRTIAEIFSERAALREQRVRVRGSIVKLTEGILGKTYLHLRDGSGSPDQQNHDLTLTTTEAFELGEIVEVEGELLVDQDIGLGYSYPALLASVTRVQP